MSGPLQIQQRTRGALGPIYTLSEFRKLASYQIAIPNLNSVKVGDDAIGKISTLVEAIIEVE
jgi:hypothetical protein